MLASYNITLVPLDPKDPAANPSTFDVQIVTDVQFSPGDHSPGDIRSVLDLHPLLSAPQPASLAAYVVTYDEWERVGHRLDQANKHSVLLKYAGVEPTTTLFTRLGNYLIGRGANYRTRELLPDGRFDDLRNDHFINVANAHNRAHSIAESFRGSLSESLGSQKGLSVSGGTPSPEAAHWLNRVVHATLMESASAEQVPEHIASVAPKAQSMTSLLRQDIQKVTRRMYVEKPTECVKPPPEKLQTVTADGAKDIGEDDPNVAVHAALKNSLLATGCGFVTSWTVTADIPLRGDFLLWVDPAPLVRNGSLVAVNSTPTALRRDSHTHPLSIVDVHSAKTTNCALAQLNSDSGPRYHAVSVNAEAALVKDLVVQPHNSLAPLGAVDCDRFGEFNDPLDKRPPQLLTQAQFGSSEPEASGVTFSAPIEDLVTPDALQAKSAAERQQKLPCLFLEDLWTGYRLDLASGKRALSSIHRQEQVHTFADGRTQVKGWMEDSIAREQADDTARGYSSTELFTYRGLSSGQARDYLVFLGATRKSAAIRQGPFTTLVESYAPCERLTFGSKLEYRLRVVLLGDISLSPTEDLSRLGPFYRQSFPFYRGRSLKPGEVISTEKQPPGSKNGGNLAFFISDDKPSTSVWLVPTPLDMDGARYHGTLLNDKSEPSDDRDRVFVSDLSKVMSSGSPRLNYFCDPDVSAVTVSVKVMNGDPSSTVEQYAVHDGVYCRLSEHLNLEPEVLRYGDSGRWRQFEPIEILFSTTSDDKPSLHRSFWNSRRLEVQIPPAADVEVTVRPQSNIEQLRTNAKYASSSAQLHAREAAAALSTTAVSLLSASCLGKQVIRVRHAVKKPLHTINIVGDTLSDAPDDLVYVARRDLDSPLADLPGRIELDAASAGEVQLLAEWRDINDHPNLPQYIFESSRSQTVSRSVTFQSFRPVRPTGAMFRALVRAQRAELAIGMTKYDVLQQFDLQCSEDKIFLGETPATSGCERQERAGRINLKDTRRKTVTLQASAVSRFRKQWDSGADSDFTSLSAPVIVDVPSSYRLSTPKISHILPIGKEYERKSSGGETRRTIYGLRIYLKRPWFESGAGERLAIGCASEEDAPGITQGTLDKHVTQWGEDPLERPRLQASLRRPRAADFVPSAPQGPEAALDLALYPPLHRGSRDVVLYKDNVLLAPIAEAAKTRRVCVASFGISYDSALRLWYCDVCVSGEFVGWCGLALYRHQPFALEGRELSLTPEWAYAAILHGEPVAWVSNGAFTRLTIGPVYDPNLTFELDQSEFKDGVGANLSESSIPAPFPMKRYQTSGGWYFEAKVAKRAEGWNLIKKRFGYPVAIKGLVGHER